jgi:beta-fructofuranosidase
VLTGSGYLFEDYYYTEPGDDVACPNFLPIGDNKHLLLFFSHKRSAQYYIGTYNMEKHRFIPENHGRMNYGPAKRGSLHAPSAFIDQNGRCIAIWNIIENRPQEGWDEIMSLPRHLSLNTDTSSRHYNLNPLLINPIDEMKSLRFEPVTIGDMTIPANGEQVLSNVNGKAMELEVEIDPMKAREVGLNILRSPDGREQTTITLFMQGWIRNSNMRDLAIDVSRASLDPTVDSRSPEIGPLYLKEGEPLRLRIFIDRSVVEVFANGRQCLTLRTYPSLEESKGVSVFSRGSDAKLVSLTAYQMRSIWPELKAMEGE